MKATFTTAVAKVTRRRGDLSLFLLFLLSLNQTTLAQRIAGKFVDVTSKVPEPIQYDNGRAAWADYDGDGLQDFFIIGEVKGLGHYQNDASLFHNTGNGWENVTQKLIPYGLPGGLKFGSVTWGDYDGDGRPDLLLTGDFGYGISRYYSALFKNTTTGFHDVTYGTFADGLPQMNHSSAAWGDLNGDGKLDLVMAGRVFKEDEDIPHTPKVSVYLARNPDFINTSLFTNQWYIESEVEPLEVTGGDGSVNLVDFNSDGKPDLALSGEKNPFRHLVNFYDNNYNHNDQYFSLFKRADNYFKTPDEVPKGGGHGLG